MKSALILAFASATTATAMTNFPPSAQLPVDASFLKQFNVSKQLNTSKQNDWQSHVKDESLDEIIENVSQEPLFGALPDNVIGDVVDRVEFLLGRDEHMKALLRGRTYGARDVCTKGGRGDIYFIDPHTNDTETYTYHLTTPWKLYYPTQLKNKLKKQGFQVLNMPQGMGCDLWDPLFSVTETGVHRGAIEMNWPLNKEAPIAGVAPGTKYDWATIKNILEDTYPGLEISMTVLGSITGAMLVGVVFLLAYKFMCRKFGWNDRAQDYFAQRKRWIKESRRSAELDDVNGNRRPDSNC